MEIESKTLRTNHKVRNEMVTLPSKWYFVSISTPHRKIFPCLATGGGAFLPAEPKLLEIALNR